MNRFTVTKGTLSGSHATSNADTSVSVVAGTEGTTLGNDKLGQRRAADYSCNGAPIHETYGYSQDGQPMPRTAARTTPRPTTPTPTPATTAPTEQAQVHWPRP